jgi:hypothetical protein
VNARQVHNPAQSSANKDTKNTAPSTQQKHRRNQTLRQHDQVASKQASKLSTQYGIAVVGRIP